jgi:protein gp37
MAEETKISWADATFNHVRGCTKVSEGCKHCYAETLSKRNPTVLGMWGPQGTRVMASESYWRQPIKWDKEAQEQGVRRRVFCASLADVFEGPETCSEEAYKVIEEARKRLFETIDATPHLDWLLLTKRPENIERLWPWGYYDDQFSWPNVWLGTSVENQAAADKRIPELLKVPAKVRFLSCEPLLGAVDFRKVPGLNRDGAEKAIHWVIVGGESGPHARPMNPAWARSLRDQCAVADVPFHFKQWGAWEFFTQVPAPLRDLELAPLSATEARFDNGDHACIMQRADKNTSQDVLDGKKHKEFPA